MTAVALRYYSCLPVCSFILRVADRSALHRESEGMRRQSVTACVAIIFVLLVSYRCTPFFCCYIYQVFAFDRTISRLLEMQSESYFAASTVRYPVEAGGPPWLHRELLRLEDSAIGKYGTLWDALLYVRSSSYYSVVCCTLMKLSYAY